MADEEKRDDRGEGVVEAGDDQQEREASPEQDTEQEGNDLSALGPYVPTGQSEPDAPEPQGDAVTAVEPQTEDDLQGD